MKQHDPTRRSLLKRLAVGAACTLPASAIAQQATTAVAKTPPKQSTHSGYRESPHIQAYYRTLNG